MLTRPIGPMILLLALAPGSACDRGGTKDSAPADAKKSETNKSETNKPDAKADVKADTKAADAKTDAKADVKADTKAADTKTADTKPVDLAPLQAMMKTCFIDADKPPGELASATVLPSSEGQPVFLAHPKGEPTRSILIFGTDPSECSAYSLGPDKTKTTADLFGDGRPRTVVLADQHVDDGSCGYDDCPMAVIIKGDDGQPAFAAQTGESCGTSEISKAQVFDGRESVEVRCKRTPPDATEYLTLLHVIDDRLEPVLTVPIGQEADEPLEDGQYCTLYTAGSYEVTTKGAAPVLSVLEVEDPFEGTRKTWTYSATEHRFVAGEGKPEEMKPKRTCEPAE